MKSKEYNLKLLLSGEDEIIISFKVTNKKDLSFVEDLGYDLIESYSDKRKSILLHKFQEEIKGIKKVFFDE